MVKYGLFIFNLICAIAGIALIVVGALPLFKLGDIKDVFINDNPATVPVILVVLGSVIFIISFFGCCGAIRESQCMVSTYALFLLVLVVGQIIIAVFAFMYTGDLADAARKGYTTLWNDMGQPNGLNVTEPVNRIQSALHCCGNNGPSDWTNIPPSCCKEGTTSCNVNSPDLFPDGCGVVLHDLVSASGMLIAWIALVFGAFELVGVIFACCLANSIRNTARRQFV